MGGCCSGRLLHRDAAAGATKYAAPAEVGVAEALVNGDAGAGGGKPPPPQPKPQSPYMSIVVCGHAASGKSTAAGALLHAAGAIDEEQLEHLRSEARHAGGDPSLALAWALDTTKQARGGVGALRKAPSTEPNIASVDPSGRAWRADVIDAPSDEAAERHLVAALMQADIALLVVPAPPAELAAALAPGRGPGDRLGPSPAGGSRRAAELAFVCGVPQLTVLVTKLDAVPRDDTGNAAPLPMDLFESAADAAVAMLSEIGWGCDGGGGGGVDGAGRGGGGQDSLRARVPVLPLACLADTSDGVAGNVGGPSDTTPWHAAAVTPAPAPARKARAPPPLNPCHAFWRKRGAGGVVSSGGDRAVTLMDVLDGAAAAAPAPRADGPLVMSISSSSLVPGVGDVACGRVLQGKVQVGDRVIFLPGRSPAEPTAARVASLRVQRADVHRARAGEVVAVAATVKKDAKPPAKGDIMVLAKDSAAPKPVSSFTAYIEVLGNCVDELRSGCRLSLLCGGGRVLTKLARIQWVLPREEGGGDSSGMGGAHRAVAGIAGGFVGADSARKAGARVAGEAHQEEGTAEGRCLHAGDVALVEFQVAGDPLRGDAAVVEPFKWPHCEALSRIAFESSGRSMGVVAIGKVKSVVPV